MYADVTAKGPAVFAKSKKDHLGQNPPSFNSLEDFPPLERSCKKSVGKGRCPVCKWSVCKCQNSKESLSFWQTSEIDDSSEYLKGGARPKKSKSA